MKKLVLALCLGTCLSLMAGGITQQEPAAESPNETNETEEVSTVETDEAGPEETETSETSRIMVIRLSDDGKYFVDQVQAEFIIEAIERAEEEGYDRIILKIDTYGGVVMSARDIAERLIRSRLPTTAYVETKAISAGIFIAWACDEIVMQEHTTIGDAQMVFQNMEGKIEEAPEKMVTVYRSDWKKSSTAKNRSFALAQGFF